MKNHDNIKKYVIDFSQISDEYIGDKKIINKKCDPCESFKKELSICMKNSDNNIIECQSLRNAYESCIRENKE